jgi:hypothetical protein
MTSIDTIFCRALLRKAHALVKQFDPDIHVVDRAWVYCFGRGHWEFHGPDVFYWHGRASSAYHARYRGWMAWLQAKGALGEERAV